MKNRAIGIGLMVLRVVIFIAVYYLGFIKISDRTEAIEAETSALRKEESVLSIVSAGSEENIESTTNLIHEGEKIVARYPSEIREENMIMYAAELEEVLGCTVSYISTPAMQQVNVESYPVANVLTDITDITGAVAAYTQAYKNMDKSGALNVEGISLYQGASDIIYNASYETVKEIIKKVFAENDTKNVQRITMAYDSTTGLLTGNITLNYYALAGTGKKYVEPNMPTIYYGTNNIFGDTLEAGDIMEILEQ